ncbi:MAG: NACHT domain-containing protein [Ruminococcus sp.]
MELMQIIADNSTDISERFGGSIDRFLLRLLRSETDYPYSLFSFEKFEQSIGNPRSYVNYLLKIKKLCSSVLDEDKVEQLVYTLLEIIRQDSNISTILYGSDYISKEKLFGSYAHPKRICIEALLLGLLYHVHKNPAESESIGLLDIPEKLTFHVVRYKDENSLALEMPIDLTENISENAKRQKSAKMKYQLELKSNDIAVERLPEKDNIFIYGTGGAGKTTLLMNQIGNENTISFYFPLYQYRREIHENYQSGSCWILLQILLKYHYQYDYQTYEALIANEGESAVLQQLTELGKLLKSTPVNGQPDYTLLLDGLNEMSSDTQRKFVNELELICCEWKNVQIIITGRTIPNYDLFNNFHHIEICGISDSELYSVLSVLPDSSTILFNEKLTEILKNPLFLNLFLESRTQVHTRGELIDSYIVNRKGNSDVRFILQFALPFISKRMTRFEMTKAQILSVIDCAIELYVHNDYIYQNCVSSRNINKKDLLESRRSTDWIELLTDNIGLMKPSVSEPHKLHFVHQYFRDYFAAKHILNAIEALKTVNNILSPEEKARLSWKFELSGGWFNTYDCEEYKLIGEICGDYKNSAYDNGIYNITLLDDFLDMCRDFTLVRCVENIINTMRISRNKEIYGVDFSMLKIIFLPTDCKYINCDFSESRIFYIPLFDFEYNYIYAVRDDVMILIFGNYADIAVWNIKEHRIVADYNLYDYMEGERPFYYVEFSSDGKYVTFQSSLTMVTLEIFTGKIIRDNNDFTEQEYEDCHDRYLSTQNDLPDLDDDFLSDVVVQLDRFHNCNFTGTVMSEDDESLLCRMVK